MMRRAMLSGSRGLRWQRVLAGCSQCSSSISVLESLSYTAPSNPPFFCTDASQERRRTPQVDAANAKQRLLDAALKRVPQLGWTSATLHTAARDLGLSPAAVGLAPHGSASLVEHFLHQCNEAVANELQSRGDAYSSLSTQTRVHIALKLHMEMLAPYRSCWSQALAVLAQPHNASIAASSLASAVDTIWYAAGDTATDGSWYTKRAALSAVYTATQLYMLTDSSPELQGTWSFLERRVADMFLMEGLGEAAGKQLQDLVGGLLGGVMRSMGQQQQQQQQQAGASTPAAASSRAGSDSSRA